MTDKTKPIFKEVDMSKVLPFATPRQRDFINAILQYKDVAAAAEACGVSPHRLRGALSEARQRAARRGWSPADDMKATVPEGYHVKGVSTYYRIDEKTGQMIPRGQWVKSKKDEEHKITQLLDAVQNIAEPFKGCSIPWAAPEKTAEQLLCVYPMGDPHLGMFAWHQETGRDFDLDIAERNLVRAVDQLVGLAPPAKEALIINLGDFFHSDSLDNRTRISGNPLDVDSRWPKVLSVGIRTMRRCIDRCLEKHEIVHVICEIGNHDDHSSIMLAICLREYYSNNERVKIDTSPSAFHWHRFGENLIGVTHGHRTKARDLPGIMASDRKKDWGETTFRYFYTGHVHHDSTKEYPGCIVETFRTLAPQDAWHHREGYRSDQDMKCDVLHAKFGRINRHIVGIRQIWPDE